MTRKLKTRLPVAGTLEQLSPAEQAFLTGDESRIDPDSWSEYFLWCLRCGFASWYKGRAITPWELGERYGHLVPPKRRAELEAELEELKYETGLRGGKRVRRLRPEFREKRPKREPWVVDFPIESRSDG